MLRLLEAAGRPGTGQLSTERALRDRALLELLYGIGARISEATGLDLDDVDRAQRSVLLRGKGDKHRTVPVGRFALEALDAYLTRGRPALAARGRGTPAVFLGSRGTRLTRQAAWQVVAGAAEAAELTDLPELTPSLEAFSKLPVRGYEQSWEFIKQHRDVVVPGASDALLVAAFTAQGDGKAAYAKQCVNQSLLLQYCEKLGKDGVAVFFKRCVLQLVFTRFVC